MIRISLLMGFVVSVIAQGADIGFAADHSDDEAPQYVIEMKIVESASQQIKRPDEADATTGLPRVMKHETIELPTLPAPAVGPLPEANRSKALPPPQAPIAPDDASREVPPP